MMSRFKIIRFLEIGLNNKISIIIFSLLFTYYFRNVANLCVGWDACYSQRIDYYVQVHALLEGALSLFLHPHNMLVDWAWGNGAAYQLWGLGVPILQLPFEFFYRLFFSQKYFPDEAIFLVYYFLLSIYFITTANKLFGFIGLSKIKSILTAVFFCYFFLMSVPFVNLVNFSLSMYHQAIAYNYLFCLFLVLLMLNFYYTNNLRIFYLLSFIIGFSPFIRPTGILYGLSIFIALIFSGRKKAKQSILIGCLLLGFMPSLLLYLNLIRYGSIFEFGYSLNVSHIPLNDYSLRFGSPFSQADFLSACKELFSALFSVERIIPGLSFNYKYLSAQSSFPRFREFTFSTYNSLNMYLFIFGFVCSTFKLMQYALLRLRNEKLTNFKEADYLVLIFSLVAFLSILFNFLFYLYSPSIIARYTIDFLLAINLCSVVFIICFIRLLSQILIFFDCYALFKGRHFNVRS